jgi:sulfatase maturation enzyme AslB (radical SAM superfamily)
MAYDKKVNMHSDTWCPIPFVGISLHPTGSLTRCMMSEEDMTERGAGVDSFDWDNEKFQKLRSGMLSGTWDQPGCDNCKMKEDSQVGSQRQNWLVNKLKDFPAGTFDNPQLTNNTVRHLFLNFNNVCNFKCRMCSPRYSNSLIPEHRHLVESGNLPALRYNEDQHKNINPVIPFLLANKHRLKGITSIWVTGGEPFIDNTMWKVRDILNEFAVPEQIRMTITTNGSRTDFDKLQTFENFKHIHFDLSMDTPGDMFEYMRSAGVFTWQQFDQSVIQLMDFQKQNSSWMHTSINSSYQLYNARHLHSFFQYVKERTGSYSTANLRVLVGPKWFQSRHAPDSIKQLARSDIQQLMSIPDLPTDVHGIISDCARMLNQDSDPHYWRIFKTMCKEQDAYRGVHLSDYDQILSNEVYGNNP